MKATVTVKPEESKPVPLQPEVLTASVVQGSTEDFTLPTHVPVLMSNVGTMATPPLDAWHTVNWDVTGLKLDVPGSYRITGAIDGFDGIQAVAYVNVLPRPRTVKSAEPLELTVTQGALAADVDFALLREVKVEYEDGSTGIAEVEAWDMTPIIDDALKSEGDITIEGRLVGSKIKASAIVHVVADPAKVPVRVVAPNPIEVREGSKLSALVKKLPAKVFVEMENGDKREFDVTWDAPRALGKAGSEQVVAGVTSNGMKVELKVMVTGRMPATGIIISGEGIANGSVTMRPGDELKLSFTVAPEGANSNVTWSSTDEKVVVVSGNGMLTAVGAGEATICVASVANPDAKAEFKVVVRGKLPSLIPSHNQSLILSPSPSRTPSSVILAATGPKSPAMAAKRPVVT